MTTPNPGSPMAVYAGCTCNIFKNHDGDGEPINGGKNRRFHIHFTCPIHSDFYRPPEVTE